MTSIIPVSDHGESGAPGKDLRPAVQRRLCTVPGLERGVPV